MLNNFYYFLYILYNFMIIFILFLVTSLNSYSLIITILVFCFLTLYLFSLTYFETNYLFKLEKNVLYSNILEDSKGLENSEDLEGFKLDKFILFIKKITLYFLLYFLLYFNLLNVIFIILIFDFIIKVIFDKSLIEFLLNRNVKTAKI